MRKAKKERVKLPPAVALLLLMGWVIYTGSYMGKISYNANIVSIEKEFGLQHGDAGTAPTFFFFAYGVGQIVNGLFCRKYNLKYCIFGSLAIAGAMNLLVSFVSDFSVLKYLWLINGAALSVLWPSLMRLLSETLDKKYMSRAVIVMGTTVATGTFLVYGMSALFTALNAYKITFYVAAALLPTVAIVWLCSYDKLVSSVKACSIAEENVENAQTTGAGMRSDTAFGGAEAVKKQKIPFRLLVMIVILAAFAVVDNLVKDGLTTWTPNILENLYDLPDSVSILLTLFLPVMALFGTVVAVRLHKKIKNFVTLCAALFLAASVLIGVVIGLLNTGAYVVTLCSFALVACLMSGVNNVLTSMTPLMLKDRIPSGTLAGMLNGFCYLGSMLSTYGLGSVVDHWGWNAMFWLLFVLCVAAVVIGAAYSLAEYIKRKKGKALSE